MILNKYCVYLHIKGSNGEPFYVGKGEYKRALTKEKRSIFWKNVVNKHNYDIILLEENLTNDEALNIEIYWIKRIGRRDLGLGPLVNLTDGGEGSVNPSAELRYKFGTSMRGKKQSQKWIDNMKIFMKGNKYGKGYKLTQAQKDNISEFHKGKQITEEHKQIVREYRTGKVMSNETKKKLSDKNKNKKLPSDHINKLVETCKGKIWINNGFNKCKRISENELTLFIKDGWFKGFIKFKKEIN